jgi:2-polyprenyl-6-methoxyphenol hydroxylase-like FAD-dependent oxidoreductase
MKNQASAAKQAVVIGGSLGGLFAGLLLRSIRWDVDIYERSAQDLDSRGWHRAGARSAGGIPPSRSGLPGRP